MTADETKRLMALACRVRMGVIEGTHAAKAGHPGGSLSAADLFTYLYFKEMNIDPENPQWADRDRFVLSKGHTAPGLYAALALRGFFPWEELKTLGAKFRPEEMSILAVTGANGFGGRRVREDGPWIATLELTAWKEEDGEEPARREKALLVALAGDKLLAYLRRRAMPDSIIQVTVRPSEDRTSFLMTELPQPVMDPELKAILDQQKQPVSFWEQGLGTFTLNRSVGWFEAEADWLGQPVRLDFDKDEDRADCLAHFHALMEGQQEWDQRVRAFAAEQLLELANDWEQDSAGNEEREP